MVESNANVSQRKFPFPYRFMRSIPKRHSPKRASPSIPKRTNPPPRTFQRRAGQQNLEKVVPLPHPSTRLSLPAILPFITTTYISLTPFNTGNRSVACVYAKTKRFVLFWVTLVDGERRLSRKAPDGKGPFERRNSQRSVTTFSIALVRHFGPMVRQSQRPRRRFGNLTGALAQTHAAKY